jgi:hypothetical protein
VLASGGVPLVAALVTAQLLPGINASCVYLAVCIAFLAIAVALTESGAQRIISANLFVCAMLARVLTALVCYLLAFREGGPFLGPDSTTYFRMSSDLAARAFHLDTLPVVHFGSYDVAHYYLYAAAIRYFDADLFGLQIMNGGLMALAAPLSFGFTRLLLPRAAPVVGLAVALHPSLIVMPAVDLLKDSSILFATVLLIWVMLRLTAARSAAALLVFGVAGAIAALYLKTGRFYTFAYLEGAWVAAGLLMLLARRRIFAASAAIVVSAGIFLAAETLPLRQAWPPAPVMVVNTVAFALGSPGLRHYAFGLFD